MIAETIESLIKQRVKAVCSLREVPPDAVLLHTDNLGEVIEKLVIIHIRMWMLEDMLGVATTDKEIADLKLKTDICFKIKRPRLVEAINAIIDHAIATSTPLREDSVKLYRGVDIK